jgi:FKBP-type peptidyl-prolyl cis-trans isomerase
MTRDIVLGVIAIVILVGGYYFFKDRVNVPPTDNTATTTATGADQGAIVAGAVPGAESLKVEVLKQGTGVEAKSGDKVTVHYTGTLLDGTKFDSSLDRNQPFSVTLGAGQVIKGWDLGLVGMKVGEKRKLTLAPDLAYGASGVPNSPIGPNATLVFEIELLKIN